MIRRTLMLLVFSACLSLTTTVADAGILNGDFATPGSVPAEPFASWTTASGFGDPPSDGGGFASFTVEGKSGDW